MPTKTSLRNLSPFYGGVAAHIRIPPYFPPDSNPELACAAAERKRQSYMGLMDQRGVRLAHSLAYDVDQFASLHGNNDPVDDAPFIELLAYRILARCKLLADARLASARPDDEFEDLFREVYCGSADEQDWAALKKCMAGVASEADNAMLSQHFDEIWSVLEPTMRKRTPQHWLQLFYCAWQTPCDDWPPYTCWSRVPYSRRLRLQAPKPNPTRSNPDRLRETAPVL